MTSVGSPAVDGWPTLVGLMAGHQYHRRYRKLLMLVLTTAAFTPTVLTADTQQQLHHHSREYCQSETFRMTCPTLDQVIVMRSADYGRMRVGRCVHDSAYVGCRVSVLRQLDRMCSGRPSCTVPLPNPTLDAVDPCHVLSAKSYLNVTADCQKVTAPVEVGCSTDRPSIVRGLSGFLSNYRQPTSPTDPSSSPPGAAAAATVAAAAAAPCPWRIVVGRGQRINLTLVDFATPRVAADIGLICPQYAVVTERMAPSTTVRVCGGHRRRRHVHTSASNVVDVHVAPGPHNNEHFYFLLHYKAVGCPQVKRPRYGWLTRERPDIALLGCNESSVVWRLTCDDNRWTGPTVNCSPPAYDVNAFLKWDAVGLSISNNIALGALVVVGALLVFVLLLCTMICAEWTKSKRSSGRHTQLVGKSSASTRPGSSSTSANIRSVSAGTSVSAASARKADTTGLLRSSTGSGGSASKKRGRCHPESTAVSNHVIHVDMTVDGVDDDEDDEEEDDDVDDAVMASSSPSPPPPPRRDSAAELSYVREMWPMAPPPRGNASQLAGPLPCASPVPTSTDQTRAVNHRSRPVTSYVAGEYVSLAAFGLPPGTTTASTTGRRGPRRSPVNDDDVTRIRETPKYLRRERSATMRGDSGGGDVVWRQQQQQQQHFEPVSNGYDDYDGDDDDDGPYQALAKCRSTTLPRGLAASGTARIS